MVIPKLVMVLKNEGFPKSVLIAGNCQMMSFKYYVTSSHGLGIREFDAASVFLYWLKPIKLLKGM